MITKREIIISFLKKHKLLTAQILIAGFISSLLTLLIPISIGKYYNLSFGMGGQKAKALDFIIWGETVEQFLWFFGVLVLLKMITSFWDLFSVGTFQESFIADVRKRLFHKQLELDLQTYEEKGVGKYLLRYSGDLSSIKNYVVKGILRLGIDITLLFVAAAFLISLNALMFFMCFGVGILLLGAVLILNKLLYDASILQRNKKSGLLSFVSQRLNAIQTIKTFNKEKPELRKFESRTNRLLNLGIDVQRIRALIKTLIPGALYVMILLILILAHHQNTTGYPQGGTLAAILLIITVLPIFRRIFNVGTVIKIGNISFTKLLMLLNATPPEIYNKKLHIRRGDIRIKNLCFDFGINETPVFDRLNVQIPGKQLTVVRGSSGSGKSALIKILLGHYRDYTGTISFDRRDIRKVSPKVIRKRSTVVSSKYPLLGRTVFEAISYSRNPAKRKKAQQYLDMVQRILPVKERLKLDDRIGASASKLSNQQSKLLVLARALLADKPVLLVEDSYGDLDTTVEVYISELINQQKSKKTVIVFTSNYVSPALNVDMEISLDREKAKAKMPVEMEAFRPMKVTRG